MAISLSNIVVDYPGTRALDNVSAEFRFDEVHGLIGENGAGKSTFVNVLAGNLVPTLGTLKLGGRDIQFQSPREALSNGIALVSQEGSLVDSLTGAENILLGEEPITRLGIVRRKKLFEQARSLLKNLFPGVEINLSIPVADLAVADQKIIEIVRALRGDVNLVVLDEPTAALQHSEKSRLWDIIRSLPERGVGVVLISHFLSEIKQFSDRITVLRDGKHVTTIDACDVEESQLVDFMLRRSGSTESTSIKPDVKAMVGKPVLDVSNWCVGNISVDAFTLNAGEIVGLIGLTGAGHFGFARSIYTRVGVISGEIKVNGEVVKSNSIRAMQSQGVAFVPDDRLVNSLNIDGNIVENLSMVHPEFSSFGRTGVLRRLKERKEIARIIDDLNIKTSGHKQLIQNLSGGNKQKVSLGKWLFGAMDRYKIMILIEPTEGVDIGAKQEIYDLLHNLAKSGVGILIASSDLLEIEHISNRVFPFVNGRMGSEISSTKFSEKRFIEAISGEIHVN